jgi:hypothetical protein
MKAIRVEFQLRREALKALGVDTFGDLQAHAQNLWGYCTQKWLKFQDRPGKHHTQRTTLPWWVVVQSPFEGCQDATPSIRVRAVSLDQRRLVHQIGGLTASYLALMYPKYSGKFTENWEKLGKDLQREGYGSVRMADEVAKRRAKYHRGHSKEEDGLRKRKALGLFSGRNRFAEESEPETKTERPQSVPAWLRSLPPGPGSMKGGEKSEIASFNFQDDSLKYTPEGELLEGKE